METQSKIIGQLTPPPNNESYGGGGENVSSAV